MSPPPCPRLSRDPACMLPSHPSQRRAGFAREGETALDQPRAPQAVSPARVRLGRCCRWRGVWGWTCSLGLSRPGEHVPSTQPGPKWETCLLGLASMSPTCWNSPSPSLNWG